MALLPLATLMPEEENVIQFLRLLLKVHVTSRVTKFISMK